MIPGVHPRLALGLAASIPVVAVAGVIWAVVWATHYQPLVNGSETSGWRPLSAAVSVDAVGRVGDPTIYLKDRPGRTTLFGFSVRNDGDTGVSLLGVARSSNLAGLPVVRMTIGPHHMGHGKAFFFGGTPAQAVRLDNSHPGSLSPGDERVLWFVVRQGSRCTGGQGPRFHSAKGVSIAMSELGLRYRVAGLFTRTVHFAMPFTIALSCKGNVA